MPDGREFQNRYKLGQEQKTEGGMLIQRKTFDVIAQDLNESTCENIYFEGDRIDEVLHL